MKVLFLSYYWPPAGGVSAQRISHFVKNLANMGVECHVLIPAKPSYYQVDDNLKEVIPPSVHIHKVPFFDLTTAIKWIPGMGKEGNIKQKSSTIKSRVLKWIRANYFIPDPKVGMVKPYIRLAKSLHLKHEFDLVFTNGTPHSLHLAGMQLQNSLQIKWIADFRDPWTKMDYFEDLPLTRKSLKQHQDLEHQVLSMADLCLTVSNEWQKDFIDLGAKKTAVITNGFDEMIPELEEENILISHVGSLHEDRSLGLLLLAIKKLCQDVSISKKIKLVLVGNVAELIKVEVRKQLPEENVNFVGLVSHEEAKAWMGRSTALVLPINDSPDAKGRIPAKLFEYLAAKKPVAIFGAESIDAIEIIKQTNSGEYFGSEEVDRFSHFLKQSIDSKGSYTFDGIHQFSRANTAKQLYGLMEKLI